jgi:hypothetical protein
MRRFPPPWTVESIPGGFKVLDADGQSLAYVYGYADARHAQIAKGLTLDEARRIASREPASPSQMRLGRLNGSSDSFYRFARYRVDCG